MTAPFAAVLFDMDGLLVDSEPLWVRAEIEVFGAAGVVLTEEDCAETKGLRVDDVISYWLARRAWKGSPEALEAELVQRVVELVRREGRAKPGVAEALAAVRASGDPRIALASSSPSPIISAVVERLGLSFELALSAENERWGKPHPGIFLTVAERLGVAPTSCLVLEDSLNGVLAAKAARMTCIAVPEAPDPRFVIADAVVASLHDVTPERIATVARRTR